MASKKIEIMDTTLRDGEQMANVSFSKTEKLNIVKALLDQLNVDRIEITSAKVSPQEKESVKNIIKTIGASKKFEILGFVDHKQSVDWILDCGASVMNLLTKGSLKHVTLQLNKKPEEHLKDILNTVAYADSKNVDINVYLEDWSNGMIDSRDYVYFMIENLAGKVKRIMLPDTLGILSPTQVTPFIQEIRGKFPQVHFDFHPHNDYGLGTSNCLAAAQAGIDGLHVTMNGMGERAGNAPLEEVCVVLKDFLCESCYSKINEKSLYPVSRMVQLYSTMRTAPNKPIVGANVFTQTAGIHADGDKKGGLYFNRLMPERFGREREYALGKLSGKANLDQNLSKMGIELTETEKNLVLKKVIELGDRKQTITMEDLPYIIDDVIDSRESETLFKIKSAVTTSSLDLKPVASILVDFNGELLQETGSGDGGFDAFMKALNKIAAKIQIKLPPLIDYQVQIPPGGKTDALVQATIVWEINGKEIMTKGVHSDQLIAAVFATEKMMNRILEQTA